MAGNPHIIVLGFFHPFISDVIDVVICRRVDLIRVDVVRRAQKEVDYEEQL